MKRLFCLLPLLLVCSCRHLDPAGVYQGDAVLYQAELAVPTAYALIHTFVQWEHDNRPLLAKWPEITKAADNMRGNARTWVNSANSLHDAYAANPSPANRTALQTALSVLQAAMVQASAYMAAAAAGKN